MKEDKANKGAGTMANLVHFRSKYRSQPKRMIDTIPEEGGGITTTQKKVYLQLYKAVYSFDLCGNLFI